ncbi:hypothetical protein Axi01nite_07290 [Actinoplanes xinjiangensis]|nr:hypothetical protein Axi01nite_07290 [Actinoplanes xinjiangensis]
MATRGASIITARNGRGGRSGGSGADGGNGGKARESAGAAKPAVTEAERAVWAYAVRPQAVRPRAVSGAKRGAGRTPNDPWR